MSATANVWRLRGQLCRTGSFFPPIPGSEESNSGYFFFLFVGSIKHIGSA